MKKVSIKQINLILIGFILIWFGYVFLSPDLNSISKDWELRSAWYSLILVGYFIVVWIVMKFPLVSLRFFILLSLWLFHISLVIVIGFGYVEYNQYDMLYRYSEQQSCNSLFFCNCVIVFFVMGLIFFSKEKNDKCNISIKVDEEEENIELYICRYIGKILFLISFLPTMYVNWYQISLKISSGYSEVWGSSTTFYGIPLGWFTKLFLPACLLLIAGNNKNKIKFQILSLMTVLYYLIFMFLTGRKGNTIQAVVPIILMYFCYYKPKIKVKYFIGGYFGIWLIGIVTRTRDLSMNSTFWESVKKVALTSNPLIDFMYELGGTIKAVIQMQLAIPNTGDFNYGLTYITGILKSIGDAVKVIDTSSLGKYSDFSIFLSQPERGTLLNNSVAAMGGSCIAEWWWNFGYLTFVIAFIFAWIILKLEKLMIERINSPVTIAIICSFLYYLLRYTRGYILDMIWDPLFIFVVIYVMYKFINKKMLFRKTAY